MAFGIGDLITINDARYFLDFINSDGSLLFRPVKDGNTNWDWSELVGKKIKDKSGSEYKVVKVNRESKDEIWLTLDGGGYANTYSRFTGKEDFNKRFVIAKILRGKEMKKELYNIPEKKQIKTVAKKSLSQIESFGDNLKVHFDNKFKTAKIEISDAIAKKAIAGLKEVSEDVKFSDSMESRNTANGSIAYNGYDITYTWADFGDVWKNLKQANVVDGKIEILNDKFEVVASAMGSYDDFESVCEKLTPTEASLKCLGFEKKEGKYIKIASGDLVIKDNDGIAKDCETFSEALELLGYTTNMGYDFFDDADNLFIASNEEFSLGLTNIPSIIKGGYYDDNGKYVVPEDAEIYVFQGYEFLDELQILKEKGEVTFTRLDNKKDKKADQFDNGDNIVTNGSTKKAYKNVKVYPYEFRVVIDCTSADEVKKIQDAFKDIYNESRTIDNQITLWISDMGEKEVKEFVIDRLSKSGFNVEASKIKVLKKTAEIVQQTTNVFFDTVQEMIDYNKTVNKENPTAEPAQSGAPTNTEIGDTNTEPVTEENNAQPQENKTELPESDIEITPSSKKEVGTQKEADETDKKDPQESADKYELKGLIADLKTFPIFDRMTETEALNTLNEQYAVAINIENGNSAMVKSNLLKNPFYYADELKKAKEQEAQNAPVETQAQNEETVIKQKMASKQVTYTYSGTKKESDLFKKALRENGVKICGFNKKADVVLSGTTEYTAHLNVEDLCKLVLDETLISSSKDLDEIVSKLEAGIKDIVSDIKAVSIEFNDADVNDIQIDSTKGSVSVEDVDDTLIECIGDFMYENREKLGIADKAKVEMDGNELAKIYFANKKTSSKEASKGDSEFNYLRNQLMPQIMVNELGEQEEKAFSYIWDKYHDRDMNYLSENLVQISKEFNDKVEELKQNKQSDKFIGEDLGAEPAMSDDPDIKREQPFVDDNGMNFSKYQSKDKKDLWENKHSKKEMEEVIFKDLVFMILESGFTPKEAVNQIMKDYGVPFDWVYDFYWKWDKNGRPLNFNQVVDKKAYRETYIQPMAFGVSIDAKDEDEAKKIAEILINNGAPFSEVVIEGHFVDFNINSDSEESVETKIQQVLGDKGIVKDAFKVKTLPKKARGEKAYKAAFDEASDFVLKTTNSGEQVDESLVRKTVNALADHWGVSQNDLVDDVIGAFGEKINKKAYKSIEGDYGDWWISVHTNNKEETEQILNKLDSLTKYEYPHFIRVPNHGQTDITIIWKALTVEEAIEGVKQMLESNGFKKDASKIKTIEKTAKTDPAYKSMEQNLKKEKVKGKCPNCGKSTLIKKKDGIRTLREWVECTNCTLAFETDKPKKDDGYLIENGIWEDTDKQRAMMRSAGVKEISIGDKVVTLKGLKPKYGIVTDIERVQDVYKTRENFEEYKNMYGLNLSWDNNSIVVYEVKFEDEDGKAYAEYKPNEIRKVSFITKERLLELDKKANYIIGDEVVVSPQGTADYKYQGQVGKVVSVDADKYDVKVGDETLKLNKGDIYAPPNETVAQDKNAKTEDKEAVKKKSEGQIQRKEKADKTGKENIGKKASSEVEKEIRTRIFDGADAYTHKDVWDKTINRVIEDWIIRADERYGGRWTVEEDTNSKYPSNEKEYNDFVEDYFIAHIDDIVEEIQIKGEEEIRKKNASNKTLDLSDIQASSEEDLINEAKKYNNVDEFVNKTQDNINRFKQWDYQDALKEYNNRIDKVKKDVLDFVNSAHKSLNNYGVQFTDIKTGKTFINEFPSKKYALEAMQRFNQTLGRKIKDIKVIPPEEVDKFLLNEKKDKLLKRLNEAEPQPQSYGVYTKEQLIDIWNKANSKTSSNKTADKNKEEKLKKLHEELDKYIKRQEQKNPNFDADKDTRAMQLKRQIDDLENNKESYLEWSTICDNDKKDFKSRIPRNRDWSTQNEEGIIPPEMQG